MGICPSFSEFMPVTVEPLATTQSNQSDDVVLSVKGVSKKFCRSLKRSLWYGIQDLTGELLGSDHERDTLRDGEFWALKDISFELRRGEALGLVGANGAGKTTLLRIISGLIKPDQGEIEINGRIAPLIALGAGFNPILSGRENIYANMSILGLTRQEIDDRFEDVVAFAEIGEALDAPVQSYSSGMAARLGFACAIHTEPDILLIDEVLAVGDIKFRSKCFRQLSSLSRQGTSFIMVSHQIQAILQMCSLALYFRKGRMIRYGDSKETTDHYHLDLFEVNNTQDDNILYLPEKSKHESLGLDIKALYFKNQNNQTLKSISSGQKEVDFCILCQSDKTFEDISVYFKVFEVGGEDESILFIGSPLDGISFTLHKGIFEIKLRMPYIVLPPGIYTMSLRLKRQKIYTIDFVELYQFKITYNSNMSQCKIYQPRAWNLIEV